MRQLKIGIVGAGAISHEHYAGISRHPQASVEAIAEMHPQRRAAFARQYHVPRTFASPEEMIADRELDAITIGVPNAFHAPLATMALHAGKHVLLEKPFARNLKEAQGVAQAARRSGKVLMVGMNKRFCRESQVVKALINQGQLGEVYHGKSAWMRRSGIPRLGTWFGHKDLAGGGALLDIGVHMLDLCLYLMGNFQPEAVTGATYSKFGPRGLGEGDWGKSDPADLKFDVEDFATALIKLKGGVTVSLDVSWAIHQEPVDRQEVHIFGTEGGVSVLPTPRLCQQLNKPAGYALLEPLAVPLAFPACCRFANWIDAILGQAAPLCRLDEALVVQSILEAVYESAASGKEVRITPSPV